MQEHCELTNDAGNSSWFVCFDVDTPDEAVALLESVLVECTSYQIAGKPMSKADSEQLEEEVAEAVLQVCWVCPERHVCLLPIVLLLHTTHLHLKVLWLDNWPRVWVQHALCPVHNDRLPSDHQDLHAFQGTARCPTNPTVLSEKAWRLLQSCQAMHIAWKEHHLQASLHVLQDEGIGGQAEPEMGGAAAPQPAPHRMTHADRISSSEYTLCHHMAHSQQNFCIACLATVRHCSLQHNHALHSQ